MTYESDPFILRVQLRFFLLGGDKALSQETAC